MSEIDRLGTQLVHQLLPFERMAQEDNAEAASFRHNLSTGYALKGREGGLEQQLIEFLDEPKRKIDRTTWFDFDGVHFADGVAELDRDYARAQLANIVAILKSYVKVQLKIGGYTDNVGAAAANLKLSAERALAIKKELVTLGVAATRIETEGYGVLHPRCVANDTDECRAKNRRMAVQVTEK